MSIVNDLYVLNNLDVSGTAVIGGNAIITGDLLVSGTTTSIDSSNVNIKDSHVLLNKDYVTVAGKSGGLIVNYLPTETKDTVTSNGFDSTTTVDTTSAATFTAGDFIQISGTVGDQSNLGLFEVSTHVDNVLTIAVNSDYCQTAFVVDTTLEAVITKVNIGINQCNTSGTWQSIIGSSSGGLTTKNFLLTGDAPSNTTQTLTDETNQLLMGTTGVITLSAVGDDNATITLPDSGGVNDTVAYLTLAQTLASKTLTVPKINDTSSNHTYNFAVSELTDNRNVTLPLLTDDDEFTFNSQAQTLLNKTLTTPNIQANGGFKYTIKPSVINVNADITLPLLTGSDSFTFNDHPQTLKNKTLKLPKIDDTSFNHTYNFAVSELTENINVTLPLLTNHDEFTFNNHIQTLAGKTLTVPKINDTSSNHTYNFAVSELIADRNVTLPLLTDDDEFTFNSHIQTLAGKTLTVPKINDTSSDHTYNFAVSELIADRIVTLPLLVNDDEFVFRQHLQTLTNKTLVSPVLTGITKNVNGTVGAPSYSFTNATTSGLFYDGANSIDLAFGGNAIVEVAATGIVVNGSVTMENVIEGVKAYSGAGAHVLGTDGKRVNTVSHTIASSVTLPDGPSQGTKYTIVNISTGTVTINRSGADTIDDNASTSLAMATQYQRITLQYIGTIWYIV
jgi:hypothetical protein